MPDLNTDAPASSTSAVDRFMFTPELILCVLKHLVPHDLLAVSRVHRFLTDVIQQSKSLTSRLASGPSKHFTDLPAHVWNLDNVGLNTRDFPAWSYGYLFHNRVAMMRVPDSKGPLVSMRISDPGPLSSVSRPEEHMRLHFDWTPDTAGHRSMSFDPVHNRCFPTDWSTRKLFIDHARSYPTDPPLPTTVSVSRAIVTSIPALYHILPAPLEQWSYRYASVEAKVGPCTFDDMIKVALVLYRTSPKGRDSATDCLAWHPHADYPHLVSDVDLNNVIDMIEDWPVIYNKV